MAKQDEKQWTDCVGVICFRGEYVLMITARLGPKIADIPAIFEGYHYRLHDYIATWTGGEPAPGDDAADCAFIPVSQVSGMKIWAKTRDVILDGYALWTAQNMSRNASVEKS